MRPVRRHRLLLSIIVGSALVAACASPGGTQASERASLAGPSSTPTLSPAVEQVLDDADERFGGSLARQLHGALTNREAACLLSTPESAIDLPQSAGSAEEQRSLLDHCLDSDSTIVVPITGEVRIEVVASFTVVGFDAATAECLVDEIVAAGHDYRSYWIANARQDVEFASTLGSTAFTCAADHGPLSAGAERRDDHDRLGEVLNGAFSAEELECMLDSWTDDDLPDWADSSFQVVALECVDPAVRIVVPIEGAVRQSLVAIFVADLGEEPADCLVDELVAAGFDYRQFVIAAMREDFAIRSVFIDAAARCRPDEERRAASEAAGLGSDEWLEAFISGTNGVLAPSEAACLVEVIEGGATSTELEAALIRCIDPSIDLDVPFTDESRNDMVGSFVSWGVPPDVAECMVGEIEALGYDLRAVITAPLGGDPQALRDIDFVAIRCSSD